MRVVLKYAGRALLLFMLAGVAYLCVLAFPQPAFSYHSTYENFEIWSDRPIEPEISAVLDDAKRRLQTSVLYSSDQKFRVFFCNSSWRLWLYDGVFDTQLGGAADTLFYRNIYIRATDITSNSIYPSRPGPLTDAAHRPLSYFIAHEATHVMESRTFGRLMGMRFPLWLNEGYADYVGKGGDFSFEENRKLLAEDDPLLDYKRSHLYRLYQLEVAFLLEKRGLTIAEVYADPPREDNLLRLLTSDTPI
jgi:hypothetical protein